uniref:G patch domain-containing protein 4 n=1 Tax=Cynoglossus semilaevis TaxID=244447 RepID=A0A3P8VZN2_CYNSE
TMAEAQKKSRATNFAEQQLLRHGWEHGKGLGRSENGISEAIKVKVKCDKGGVGHKEGEQFTYHWWDHVFNKASSSLQVESDQVCLTLLPAESPVVQSITLRVTSSATLLSGQEQPEPKSSLSDDDSSSDEDDNKLDLSSTTKLSDADLIKVCGGRTAHKGARHGFNMSAKLARLEQQEAEFMAKYGNRAKHSSSSLVCDKQGPTRVSSLSDLPEEMAGNAPKIPKPDVKPRRKSKPVDTDDKSSQDEVPVDGGKTVVCHERKRKRKSKNRTEQHEEEGEEEKLSPAAKKEGPEESVDLHGDNKKKKKKKKKKNRLCDEEEQNLTT